MGFNSAFKGLNRVYLTFTCTPGNQTIASPRVGRQNQFPSTFHLLSYPKITTVSTVTRIIVLWYVIKLDKCTHLAGVIQSTCRLRFVGTYWQKRRKAACTKRFQKTYRIRRQLSIGTTPATLNANW